MSIYLIYHVNKGLCIIPKEISDHLDQVGIREDGCYQRGALVCRKRVAD